MFCKNCGKPMQGNSDFCTECGSKQQGPMNLTATSGKPKKPIYNKWWFWVIAVVVAIGVIGNLGNQTEDTPDTSPQTDTPPPAVSLSPEVTPNAEPSEEPSPEIATNDPEMSADEFADIEMGLTYAEIVEIVGGDGELLSESDIGMGDAYIMQIYTWDGNGSFGSNANVTFQGGVSIAKAQIGLK